MPLVAVKPNPDGTIPVAPTENQPLLVDANTGRLLVDTEANLTADLSSIESKMDTANGIATTTAADLAAVKTQLASGTIAVTGGGGGGGGASAAYNATLPTYTSGASTVLQTDQNGRLITTGPELATIASEAQAIDNKLPALSSGRVPVEANNAASQVYNFTQSGAIAANTVLIGPIDCGQFREISLQVVSIGAGGMQLTLQLSNDGTNWLAAPVHLYAGSGTNIFAGNINSANLYTTSINGARFFRVIVAVAATSGTTNLIAYASQQATPKLYQSVTGSVSISTTSLPSPAPSGSNGFATFHTLVSAASTNATSVVGASRTIGTCLLTNTTASFKFFKVFNLNVAPTMGTSTPVLNFPIPPNSTLDVSTAFAGLRLGAGIAYAITGGSALLDATAVGAGEVIVNISYA